MALRIFFFGLCMGAADLIPGISGGTIAFVMGFYETLLESLKTLNFKNLKLLLLLRFKEFSDVVAWKFLLPLGGGVIFSFILLSGFFHSLLSDPFYRTCLYSAFLGLVSASFIFFLQQIKQWSIAGFCLLLSGACIAYLLTSSSLFHEMEEEAYAVSIENLPLTASIYTNYLKNWGFDLAQSLDSLPRVSYFTWIDPWLIFCGMAAISAMLLPGISGSYLLTILGVYASAIGALAELIDSLKNFSFDPDACFILFNLLIGILIGMASVTRCISWLLRNYRQGALALLAGFMIGSIRAVWPFWSYEYILDPRRLAKGPMLIPVDPIFPDWRLSIAWIASLICLVSFFLVFLLERSASRSKKM